MWDPLVGGGHKITSSHNRGGGHKITCIFLLHKVVQGGKTQGPKPRSLSHSYVLQVQLDAKTNMTVKEQNYIPVLWTKVNFNYMYWTIIQSHVITTNI